MKEVISVKEAEKLPQVPQPAFRRDGVFQLQVAKAVGSDPQATAAGPHGRDQGPLVEIWVVAFSCGEASMPVITPANIHLQTGLRMLHLICIPLQLQSK